MKYLLMIHSEEEAWKALSQEEQDSRRARYGAFVQRAGAAAVLRAGELRSTASATTVRVRNGETLVTDGPYAETKEALRGFFLVEAESVDEAVELAKLLPEPIGGGIEIRPVYVDEGSQS